MEAVGPVVDRLWDVVRCRPGAWGEGTPDQGATMTRDRHGEARAAGSTAPWGARLVQAPPEGRASPGSGFSPDTSVGRGFGTGRYVRIHRWRLTDSARGSFFNLGATEIHTR